MRGNELAWNLRQQEPGRGKRQANAACNPKTAREPAQHHETADHYPRVVARLCARHRVIVCRDGIQWISQRREGQRGGRARWAGVGYFLARDALLRVSRRLCARIDPAALAALAALPDRFGGGAA